MRKFLSIFLVLVMVFVMVPPHQDVHASPLTKTVTFTESRESSQTKTVPIVGLGTVEGVTVDNGSVEYTKVCTNDLAISVSGGTPRVENPSRLGTDSRTSTSLTSFPATVPGSYTTTYENLTYTGTLSKSKLDSVCISGSASNSMPATTSITSTINSFVSTVAYSEEHCAGLYSGTLSKTTTLDPVCISGSASASKPASTSETNTTGSFPSSVPCSQPTCGGTYSGTLYASSLSSVQTGGTAGGSIFNCAYT